MSGLLLFCGACNQSDPVYSPEKKLDDQWVCNRFETLQSDAQGIESAEDTTPEPAKVDRRTPELQAGEYVTPTELVPLAHWPVLSDDLNFHGMELALERQLSRYSKKKLEGTIRFGMDTYPLTHMKKSLERFFSLLKTYRKCEQKNKKSKCLKEFTDQVQLQFVLYRPRLIPGDPRYGELNPTLFTGYYTPQLDVMPYQTEEYSHGIYLRPSSEELRQLSRHEIDFQGKLFGTGNELYFAKNLFDLYLLHVQGGGRVRILGREDQPPQYISFSGTNGQKWTFISKYMREQGYISNSSIGAQRSYLNQHPEKEEEIFSTCPSYVYFQKSEIPPHGSDSVALTDNRSIATDRVYYNFKGGIAFVSAERPVENQRTDRPCDEVKMRPFSRFYIDQDTGGAIRGKARVDLYFGEGDYAEFAAYNTVTRGDLYFLMLNKAEF